MIEVATLQTLGGPDMGNGTFSAADMTTYCGLVELGLVAVGMRCQEGGFVLKCRAAEPARLCPGCGCHGYSLGSRVRRLAHEPRVHRACQFFCVWGLEVGGDSVGVGGGELGEGLFPVGGGVSLDEAGVSCSFVGGFASVCEALGGAFVFDVADGEPQEFDGGFFAGEMPAVLGDFT